MRFSNKFTIQLENKIGKEGRIFVESAINAVAGLLPHTEHKKWAVIPKTKSTVIWADSGRKQLRIIIEIEKGKFSIEGYIQRLEYSGPGENELRTLHHEEQALMRCAVNRLSTIFNNIGFHDSESLSAVLSTLQELIAAAYLKGKYAIEMDLSGMLRQLRLLSGQSYENKDLTFGCIIDYTSKVPPEEDAVFPNSFMEKNLKRFKAMSDGYHTAYKISSKGALLEFKSLDGSIGSPINISKCFYPDGCKRLAICSNPTGLGLSLTRQGDLIVFENGTLRFTYKAAMWSFWSHSHILNLLNAAARVQGVSPKYISKVVSKMYRTAIDISFRRSGCLLVLLKAKSHLGKIVRAGDALGGFERNPMYKYFDAILPKDIISIDQSVLDELASLDGAVVIANNGNILAYGAVLISGSGRKTKEEEGSRTKAAISASNYGMAMKVSSDGDITVFLEGKKYFEI